MAASAAETFDGDCRLQVDFASVESQESFHSRWMSTAFRWFAENEGEDLAEPRLVDVDTGETLNLADIIDSLESDCLEDESSGLQA
ncbi:hypothetical protein TRAPUB_14334 [Trametes pubescens]|uniref:Uncharacterized protein n=1 Tax=Trametes pubescens TaxID=154538 RepID=A0A1M2VNT4_TRAPU|nr:hypothetical protein TRAPUB_14334 [Trametes pubescens]